MGPCKIAVVLVACAVTVPTHAQEMDWGPTMATIAHADATDEAGREAARPSTKRSGTASKADPSARSRRICTDARAKTSGGTSNPEMVKLLNLCGQAGL